jgi:hypothetical protein
MAPTKKIEKRTKLRFGAAKKKKIEFGMQAA